MTGLKEFPVETMTGPWEVGKRAEPHRAPVLSPHTLFLWKGTLLEELNRSAIRRRLALGLAGVAVIHLTIFLLCQLIFDPGVKRDMRHVGLWFLELVAILVYLNRTLGTGWIRSSTAIMIVAKLWTTFLILSFNVVTLNSLTGLELPWYRPVWGTLSTFLFASMAWLFNPWFLVPAVQMWATGLLMLSFPNWGFLIYGISWWLALTGVAFWIRRRDQQAQALAGA